MNSLEFSGFGPGYHFISCGCLCPLTAASQSAHYQTYYQLPELCSRCLRLVQICTGSSSSAQLWSFLPVGMQVWVLSLSLGNCCYSSLERWINKCLAKGHTPSLKSVFSVQDHKKWPQKVILLTDLNFLEGWAYCNLYLWVEGCLCCSIYFSTWLVKGLQIYVFNSHNWKLWKLTNLKYHEQKPVYG